MSDSNRHDTWMVNVGVRVEKRTRDQLAELAKQNNTTISAYTNRIILEHLAKLGKNLNLTVDS